MKHATPKKPAVPGPSTAASAGVTRCKMANVRNDVASRKKVALRKRPSRRPKEPTFGDLCEWSGGLAVMWRRRGCTEREMREFVDDDEFVLCDVVPALHALGFTEDEVIRYVPHDGVLAALVLGLSRFMTARGPYSRGSGILALPPWLMMAFFRRMFTRRIAALRNKAARPAHYEAEKARRQAMAEERRRMSRRTTTSPCPTREALLDAWRHVRDSKESLVRFGSMMQDLECYVDNSLRFDEYGRIVGRNAGVKGWLRENLPELAEQYGDPSGSRFYRQRDLFHHYRRLYMAEYGVSVYDVTDNEWKADLSAISDLLSENGSYRHGSERHVRQSVAYKREPL